jgi:hypothetical protein
MVFLIKFGTDGDQFILEWDKQLLDFPQYVKYKNKKWEWLMYDEDETSYTDYILTYTEMNHHDPAWGTEMIDFENLLYDKATCECGAKHTSFEWDHMKMCKLWRPW